jgi:hypothetical protein
MPKFLIEIPHENSKAECLKAVSIFKTTGSHYLSNADWGCSDDIHKAWIIAELDSKDQASLLIPPWYRDKAIIVTLEKLALNDIDKDIAYHED